MTNRDEDRYAVVHPDEDAEWTSADVLGELMAGSFAHGAWVQIHGVDLRLGGSSHTQNVWYVHPPDGDEPIEALNLGAFRTASALEEYLEEFDPANPSG
jgi:hypothetical protein